MSFVVVPIVDRYTETTGSCIVRVRFSAHESPAMCSALATQLLNCER
jgi:hypothetical protein